MGNRISDDFHARLRSDGPHLTLEQQNADLPKTAFDILVSQLHYNVNEKRHQADGKRREADRKRRDSEVLRDEAGRLDSEAHRLERLLKEYERNRIVEEQQAAVDLTPPEVDVEQMKEVWDAAWSAAINRTAGSVRSPYAYRDPDWQRYLKGELDSADITNR